MCLMTKCSRILTPRKHDLIIKPIELHVLETPSFIDASRNILLPPSDQIGCMKHGDLDPFPMVDNQICQKRGT